LPSDRPILRLEDIVENIDRVERYTKHHTAESFAGDRQCQDAVERCLLRISEAARKLQGMIEPLAPSEPWADIRALGNVLRHEYDDIDSAVIWHIVITDLPPLKRSVRIALQKLSAGRA
jgi:uncharacterized protein with HEPN domain